MQKNPESLFLGSLTYADHFDHSMSSPELLPPINAIKQPRRWFDTKTDMWTLGCIIFNMATGVPPFYVETNNQTDLHRCIRKADWKTQFKPFAKICSTKLGDILDKCLDPNPNTRLSASEAV